MSSFISNYFLPPDLINKPKVLYCIIMRAKIFVLGLILLLIPLSGYDWQELFTEPIEKICIIMKDKVVFRFTSLHEKAVYLSVEKVEKELKKHNYKMEDIEIIIHNHFADYKFSESDEGQYRALRRRKFKGTFLLYCHRTNKTYDIEDEVR